MVNSNLIFVLIIFTFVPKHDIVVFFYYSGGLLLERDLPDNLCQRHASPPENAGRVGNMGKPFDSDFGWLC